MVLRAGEAVFGVACAWALVLSSSAPAVPALPSTFSGMADLLDQDLGRVFGVAASHSSEALAMAGMASASCSLICASSVFFLRRSVGPSNLSVSFFCASRRRRPGP
jgi:hypothetical protein